MTVDPYRGIPLWILFRLVRLAGVKHAEVTPKFLDSAPSAVRSVRKISLGMHLPNAGIEGWDFSSGAHEIQISDFIAGIQKLSTHFVFDYAVCHPPEASENERSMDLYFHSLRKLKMPIVLENIQTCTGSDFFQFHSCCKQALGEQLLGVCLDIPHAVLSGHNWQRFFFQFGPQVKVVHLSDIEGNADQHRPFGKRSVLSLPSILGVLNKYNYQGILNFEMMPAGARDIATMFRNIRQARKLFE